MSGQPEFAIQNDQTDTERRDELLRFQHGVIHRRDLTPGDLRTVKRQVIARRWQRVGRDVFVTHNGPLTPDQKMWAYLLAGAPGSALSGVTAASIDGLRGFSQDAVYLTVPCGTSAPRLDGLVAHYSRFLDDADVHPLREPRRTRPARSLIDAATWAKKDDSARAIILAGVQQRLVTPALLEAALPSRAHCLRRGLIDESISDAEGGVASVPERQFVSITDMFAIPPPSRQRIVQRPDGRYYLDADWEKFRMSAEIDGRPHMSVLQWDADLDRANEIAIDDRTIFRFTSYAIRHKAMRVGNVLMRALIARGWLGR